ncbi:MAG: hypothetical protein R2800_04800 [Flavipsychrobacter sp.]
MSSKGNRVIRNRLFLFMVFGGFFIVTAHKLYDRYVTDDEYHAADFREYLSEFEYFSSLHNDIFEPSNIGESYIINYTAKGLFWERCISATNNIDSMCKNDFIDEKQEKRAKTFMADVDMRAIIYEEKSILFIFAGYPQPVIVYGSSKEYESYLGLKLADNYTLYMME